MATMATSTQPLSKNLRKSSQLDTIYPPADKTKASYSPNKGHYNHTNSLHHESLDLVCGINYFRGHEHS